MIDLVRVPGEGPIRTLPDQRAHELFEAQAWARPTAIAATQGERHLTYSELNSRANQLARALLERGLSREGVVGVVTERNIDWLTAALTLTSPWPGFPPTARLPGPPLPS